MISNGIGVWGVGVLLLGAEGGAVTVKPDRAATADAHPPALTLAKDEETAVTLQRVARAARAFHEDVGRLPIQLEELTRNMFAAPERWKGPYLPLVPPDAWGRPLRWDFEGKGPWKAATIISDGEERGRVEDDLILVINLPVIPLVELQAREFEKMFNDPDNDGHVIFFRPRDPTWPFSTSVPADYVFLSAGMPDDEETIRKAEEERGKDYADSLRISADMDRYGGEPEVFSAIDQQYYAILAFFPAWEQPNGTLGWCDEVAVWMLPDNTHQYADDYDPRAVFTERELVLRTDPRRLTNIKGESRSVVIPLNAPAGIPFGRYVRVGFFTRQASGRLSLAMQYSFSVPVGGYFDSVKGKKEEK